MVPENAFPAFKPVALAGKVAAICKIAPAVSGFSGFSRDFIEIHHFEDFPQLLENTVSTLILAACFPASATALNAGNAFFGTIQGFCTEEILQNSIQKNEF